MLNSIDVVRMDKWLWVARFFKTRSQATEAVVKGKVDVNDERVKPAHNIKVGDKLVINNGANEWEVVLQRLVDVRGAAVIAQTLYRETDQSVAKRAGIAENRKYFHEPTIMTKGHPTKRDSRLMDKNQL